MLFTTQFELNITIKDMNAIYSTNYDQMLLDHAKLMYQGKCRDGQYVKSIDRIVKRSLPNLITRDLTSKVRVYVVVEAKVIRYDQYDFITGMRITKIIPAGKIDTFDMIECQNDHVCALMRIQGKVDTFKVGDIIPIRVGESMYKIGNEHILVNGYPFLPYVPDSVMYSIGKLTPELRTYYKEMIHPLIERELKRKEGLDPNRWDKFAALVHPFKKEESPKHAINLTDIDALENGIVGVDWKVPMTKMKVVSLDANTSSVITADDPKISLTRLMFHFVKWLEAINDLTVGYDTDEKYDAASKIWDLYSEHKF